MSDHVVLQPRPRGGACLGFLLGALLAVIALGVAAWLYTGARLLDFLRSPIAAMRTHIDVSQPTVLQQIQRLQRLETVRFNMEKIVSGERDVEYLPKWLVGDRLLLVVEGEAVAGVDLGKLRPEDVSVTGRRVTVTLPRGEVFSTRIDNEKTRVYSRETGLFSSLDPQLETDVRREAERQLRDAAVQAKILDHANENARATLTSLLRGLGFEEIELK
jgi:hypothetical protein